ncbi:glutamine--fructose-6-phosphate transaminase (isomerizing) [Desulfurobacterium sp.]
MCGIVGYIGKDNAKNIVINGLKRLEYRGYDSAGVAFIDSGKLKIYKKSGKIRDLEFELNRDLSLPHIAIGHTRWATHGEPNDVNAHPHVDCTGKIAVVHNGIIENFTELKKELESRGHIFKSKTDTEVIAHLVEEEIKNGKNLLSAVLSATSKLKGSYAAAVIYEGEPDKIVCVRKDSPLVIGVGEGENFLASDVPAFLSYTNRVIFLDDNECAVITADNVHIFDLNGNEITKETKEIPWSIAQAEKGGYKHFMIKEIYEQPRAVADTISGKLSLFEENNRELLTTFGKIQIVACGTSYHAGLVGKFFIESVAGIPVSVDYASEYRYRNPIIDEKTLIIAISQSGETADTLAAVRLAKKKGAKVVAICNVIGSTITREADYTIYTHAGPEISVASTKAFTTQLAALFLFAVEAARIRNKITKKKEERLLKALSEIPAKMKEFLDRESEEGQVRKIALEFYNSQDALYLGRFVNYPIALEGALKLKEISYIHAEGYPAGEMKHGPIALIDEKMPVVVVVPRDRVYEKMVSNIEEVKARKGKVIAITNRDCLEVKKLADFAIEIPETEELLYPFLTVVPLQLFAYHIADFLGYDVDQPRNLAKSVTVE